MKEPAAREEEGRVGEKREARLRTGPASWVSAPTRARTHLRPPVSAKLRASIHSSDETGSEPRLPPQAWQPHPHAEQ